MKHRQIDLEAVCNSLSYDPDSGILTWKISAGKGYEGRAAGSVGMFGYLKVCVSGRHYMAHRLAWAIYYGEQPPGIIDHINQNRTDNRISNLRDGTRAVNQQNQQKPHRRNKSSSYLGVSRFAGRWRAKIYNKGKYYFLGYFSSEEEAAQAYIMAKRKLHEGCEL